MSHTLAERYSLRRLASIGIVAGIAAIVAWGMGYPRAAWGVAAATPIAMLNYLIVYRAVRQAERKESAGLKGIMLGSLGRMLISLVALYAASRFGIDAMLGALAALVAEMVSYTLDTVRSLISLERR